MNFIAVVGTALLLTTASLSAQSKPHLKSMKEMKSQGIQRQTLDYSCGASALSTLMQKYFNDSVTERDILSDILFHSTEEELEKSFNEGFSMLDLKQVAERLGYKGYGVQLSTESAKLLKGPVIILLRRSKQNHFVILQGLTEGRAFIVDPSRGFERIPIRQLEAEWRGETLILARDGFGLPKNHALSLPDTRFIAPERNSLRALQNLPMK